MNKKHILLIIAIATSCKINQTYALLKDGNPRETLEDLGNTPLTQTKEEIKKQFSIANKKITRLEERYDQAIKQMTKHENDLANCRIQQPKKQKLIEKLCMLKPTFQFCNNCSTQEINFYGHTLKENYMSNPDAHPLGGSFGKYFEMQRKFFKADGEIKNFKDQLSACNSVDCYNKLLEKLKNWNKKNQI